MVITNKEDQTYVFTKRIEFQVKGSEDIDFVELREFNMQEMKQFQIATKTDSDGKITDIVSAISKAEEFFPGCVVNSSFVMEDGSKASGKEIYNLLKKSSSLFQLILTRWLEEGDNPFRLLNKTSSK